MDLNIMLNIMRKADPHTSIAMLVAGGSEYFAAAKAFDLINTVPFADMEFDVAFQITDTAHTDDIIQRIKTAFQIDALMMIDIDTYQIISDNTVAFLRGLVYLSEYRDEIELIDDVRLQMPPQATHKHSTIVEVAENIKVVVEKSMFNMFYLDFETLVKKSLHLKIEI